MVFTIDVGNTNIVLGAFKNDKLVFTSRIATQSHYTEDQYAITLADIIRLYDFDPKAFSGAIISSVVPSLIGVLKNAVKKLMGINALVVGPGIKTGLNIRLEDPAILGADLVCGAVGALAKYKAPLIIFDFGTATTISAIDKNGNFLGGSIIPGVNVSLKALSSSAALLQDIGAGNGSPEVIGTNTPDSMRSGVILGNASMVDGMVERYREKLGENAKVVATGGLAGTIIKHCKTPDITLDDDLLLDGLYTIYKKNR